MPGKSSGRVPAKPAGHRCTPTCWTTRRSLSGQVHNDHAISVTHATAMPVPVLNGQRLMGRFQLDTGGTCPPTCAGARVQTDSGGGVPGELAPEHAPSRSRGWANPAVQTGWYWLATGRPGTAGGARCSSPAAFGLPTGHERRTPVSPVPRPADQVRMHAGSAAHLANGVREVVGSLGCGREDAVDSIPGGVGEGSDESVLSAFSRMGPSRWARVGTGVEAGALRADDESRRCRSWCVAGIPGRRMPASRRTGCPRGLPWSGGCLLFLTHRRPGPVSRVGRWRRGCAAGGGGGARRR